MALLRLIDQFIDQPVRSLRTGQPVGEIIAPVIDPKTLRVVAFRCISRFEPEDRILRTDDIREFGQMGALINDEDEMVPPEDLIRMQEVLELNYQLVGKAVRTELKHRVGKVSTFVLDDQSFFIQKLYVSQSILKNLSQSNRVIGRQQIVEVTPTTVVVRDADLKVTAAEAVTASPPAGP